MPLTSTGPFVLQHDGHSLQVDTDTGWLTNSARLLVDGEEVDRGQECFEPVKLTGGGLDVTIRWNAVRQVTSCTASCRDTSHDADADPEELVFHAPAGSHAWKMAKLQRERPMLYASRHVAIAVLQLLIGLLGIGALLLALAQGVLPAFDLPSIPYPDMAVPLPDWLEAVFTWTFSIPGLAWGLERLQRFTWLIPIVIAVFVAIEEYERRRHRRSEDTSDSDAETSTDPQKPTTETVSPSVSSPEDIDVPTISNTPAQPDHGDRNPGVDKGPEPSVNGNVAAKHNHHGQQTGE